MLIRSVYTQEWYIWGNEMVCMKLCVQVHLVPPNLISFLLFSLVPIGTSVAMNPPLPELCVVAIQFFHTLMTVIMVKNRTEWADVLPFGLETVRYDGSLLT